MVHLIGHTLTTSHHHIKLLKRQVRMITNNFLLTVFFRFSTGQKQQTHATYLHYYKLTVYKLFSNKHKNQCS